MLCKRYRHLLCQSNESPSTCLLSSLLYIYFNRLYLQEIPAQRVSCLQWTVALKVCFFLALPHGSWGLYWSSSSFIVLICISVITLPPSCTLAIVCVLLRHHVTLTSSNEWHPTFTPRPIRALFLRFSRVYFEFIGWVSGLTDESFLSS